MSKNRLEAFSDGVFAIVITLLILNIKLPETDYAHLPQALLQLTPNVLAYVMSFIVIGMYWLGHHVSFMLVSKTDGTFIWLNIILLLFVSFMPFPTYLMGKYPLQALPLIIYGINLIAANLTGLIMIVYIHYHPHLAAPSFTQRYLPQIIPVYASVNLSYLVAIGLSYTYPLISYIIYAIVVLVLVVFYASRGR